MNFRYTLDNPMLGTLQVEEPIGWADSQITLKRDEVMHGVVPEYSLSSFGFLCDGRDFIWEVYSRQGIEGRVGLLVEVDCAETGVYSEFFRGVLNLSTVQFQKGENVAYANIEQDNALQLVLNRIEVPVDLTRANSVNGTELPTYALSPFQIDVSEGKAIRKQILFDKAVTENLQLIWGGDNVTFECNQRGARLWYALGFPELVNDFGTDTNQTVTRGTTTAPLDPCDIGPPGPNNFSAPFQPDGLFAAPEDGTYCISDCILNFRMTGFVFASNTVSCSDNGDVCGAGTSGAHDGEEGAYDRVDVYFVIRKNGEDIAVTHVANFEHGIGTWDTGPMTAAIGGCYDLKAGDYMGMGFFIDFCGQYELKEIGLDGCVEFITFLDLELPCCLTVNVDSVKTLPNAKVQAYPPNEALDRVVRSITDNRIGVYSEYFGRTDSQPYALATEGCGARQALTTGFLIRQFPVETDGVPPDPTACTQLSGAVYNPGVFVSLKDLFDGYDSINNLGMGIATLLDRSEAIRIEKKEFFYQDVVVLELFDIDKYAVNFTREAVADRYWNEAEIGYADWQRDTANGLDEFNTGRKYVTPLKTIRNKFERICRFIASGYTFETLRRMAFKQALQGSPRNNEGSSYDDNVFVVCVEAVLPLAQIEKGGVGIANVLLPTEVYNWRISPYYNMRRWLNWLSQAALPILSGTAFWKVSKGEGNRKASGAETPQGLGCEFGDHSESDSLSGIQGRTMVYLKPEKLAFDIPISLSGFNALKANPYGLIRLHYGDGTVEDAFIQQIAYKTAPSTSSLQLIPKNA